MKLRFHPQAAILLGIAVFLASCNPIYVMRAGYEQIKILRRRERITDLLRNTKTDPPLKNKLELVLRSRQFALSIGLDPGDSYTRFSQVDRDILAWVLMASERDSFSLYTWWFPIIGSMPYKGFFDKEPAEAAGKKLTNRGYEIWIRSTDAFSTLGWFNDPVLSTTLQRDEIRIVDTILHESLHGTVWHSTNPAFNESLANFVGKQGSIDFFKREIKNCLSTSTCSPSQLDQLKRFLEGAQKRKLLEFQLGEMISALYDELNDLYNSEKSAKEKMEVREEIFLKHTEKSKTALSKIGVLQRINNAEIMQLKLYLSNLDIFDRVFIRNGNNWHGFLREIRTIIEESEEGDLIEPFELLKEGALGKEAI